MASLRWFTTTVNPFKASWRPHAPGMCAKNGDVDGVFAYELDLLYLAVVILIGQWSLVRAARAVHSAAGATTERLVIVRPDDWHLHVRDGEGLKSVVPHTARHFGRAIIMPNLVPPVTTTKQVQRINYGTSVARCELIAAVGSPIPSNFCRPWPTRIECWLLSQIRPSLSRS